MQDDYQLNMAALFRHGESVYGDANVLYDDGEGRQLSTVTATADRARRLAGALREIGVSPGDRVATFAWNTPAHLEAYLAVPAMGAVLHTVNLRLTPEEVAYVMNHAEDSVVIVDGSAWPSFAAVRPLLRTVREVIVDDRDGEAPGGDHTLRYADLVQASAALEFPDVPERAAGAMCYTSGTTGRPKGVVYSHRSMYLHAMANCMASGFGLSEYDRVLQVVPMFHANGWGFPHAAWLTGATLILPDRRLDGARLARLIETERPTVSGGVPTVWRDILEYAEAHAVDLSSLRVISCAGSPVPPALMKDYDRHGVTLLQAWGMTETSPLAAIARPPAVELHTADPWTWRTRTGRQLPGVEVRIVGDHDQILPRDGRSLGEFEVRGPWVTLAYHGGEGGDRFHDGWLRTGDVGTLDGRGFLTITDRAKDLIKSGGEWISSVVLEHALAEHPAVEEAVVIGVPDPRWQERPFVAVVVRAGHVVSASDLQQFLAGRLARWQLPERWAFVDVVPKTSVGKFDKQALRTHYDNNDFAVETI